MRRSSKLLILVAMTSALVMPISSVAAATTVTYNVAGIEYGANFAQSSFAGAAVSTSRTEYGVWNAVILHDLGGITGGTFAFKSKLHGFAGTFSGGTFGTAAGDCAKTTYDVHGVLSGGNLDVTVTRYGYMSGASCVVYLATARGTATLTFAS